MRLEHALLSRGDDLHLIPFRVGVAAHLFSRDQTAEREGVLARLRAIGASSMM